MTEAAALTAGAGGADGATVNGCELRVRSATEIAGPRAGAGARVWRSVAVVVAAALQCHNRKPGGGEAEVAAGGGSVGGGEGQGYAVAEMEAAACGDGSGKPQEKPQWWHWR